MQIITVYDSFNAVVISDKRHFIVVFLTSKLATQLRADLRSLNTLKNSFCKLDHYHVSTVIQCASNRDLNVMRRELKISLPLALQAQGLMLAGNPDISVIDDPADINFDVDIRRLIHRLPYIALAEKLTLQFIGRGKHQLPDAGKPLLISLLESDLFMIVFL